MGNLFLCFVAKTANKLQYILMKKIKNIKKLIVPFLWAVGIGWKTNPGLFVFTSVSSIVTSSVSGIVNTYIIAQTTASVALLATGKVSVRTANIMGGRFWAIYVSYGCRTAHN